MVRVQPDMAKQLDDWAGSRTISPAVPRPSAAWSSSGSRPRGNGNEIALVDPCHETSPPSPLVARPAPPPRLIRVELKLKG